MTSIEKATRGRVVVALDFGRVGAALREVRELAKLRQRHVAERLDVTDGAVSQWESGARELKPSQLQEFAALVELDFDGLLYKLGMPR